MLGVLTFLKNDLHRNPLHNLDVIASGIFRRQQTVASTCGAGSQARKPD